MSTLRGSPASEQFQTETSSQPFGENIGYPQRKMGSVFIKRVKTHRWKVVAIFQFIIFVIIVVALIAVGLFNCDPHRQACNLCILKPPTTEAPGLRSCNGDGFSVLNYTDRENNTRLIRYKVFLSLSSSKSFFNNVVKNCEHLNATLWEVEDGEGEWEGMRAELNSTFLYNDIWMNGFILNTCLVGDVCDIQQAKLGKGLNIRWLAKDNMSLYSRAIKEASGESTCSYVDHADDFLWKAGRCNDEKPKYGNYPEVATSEPSTSF